MKYLDIDWEDLELAFREVTGTENYLDTLTGAIMSIVDGYDDEEETRALIRAEPHRWLPIIPLAPDDVRIHTSQFIEQLPPGTFRFQLQSVISSPGGLGLSEGLIKTKPSVARHYFQFIQAAFWDHVQAFLRQYGLASTRPIPQLELFEDVA